MNITLLCYSTFVDKSPANSDNYPIKEGSTVGDVLVEVGIPQEEVKIIFVNGRSSEINTVLIDGDRVGVFPAVGGG